MKKKYFYSHIVETSSISLALADMDLTVEERKHLLTLVEANIHKMLIELVLSELSQEDKKTFLLHLAHDNHQKTWTLLETKIDAIEEKIRKAAEQVKKQFHKDIEEAKQQN